jgi:hypothetical protein
MVAKMLSGSGFASAPEGTGKAIARAATVRRPRTRYAVGLGAKPIILLRRFLPDRVYDRLVQLTFRVANRVLRSSHTDPVPAESPS